jgi:hypothetical protein
MAKKTLTQKADSVPYPIPANKPEREANKTAIERSMGNLLSRNRGRFKNWDDALDDEWLVGRLFDMLRKGNYIETSVTAAGIPRHVYDRWRSLGAEDLKKGKDSRHAMFVAALESIHAQAEVSMVDKIMQSHEDGEKLPVALCWLLERTRGSAYKQNVAPASQTNVQVNINGVQAPAAGADYKTWLENKEATEKALKTLPPVERRVMSDIPSGVETIEVVG